MMNIATTYNTIASKFSATRHAPWGEFTEFFKYLPENGNILDIGCGNGRLLQSLNIPSINSYTGIDISAKLLQEAKNKHQQTLEQYKEKICFLEDDMTTLRSIEGQTYDAIFLIASFHHLSTKQDRLQVLKNLKTLLAPKGYIFMTNWNLFQKKYIPYILENIVQKMCSKKMTWNDTFIPFEYLNTEGKTEKIKRYYHAFTPSEFKALLLQSGFVIKESFSYDKNKKVSPWFLGRNLCHIIQAK